MLNNLKHILILILLISTFFIGFCAYAASNHLVLVYPHNGATISANSTFFIGNTHPKATLTLNGKPAKVYKNGAFVRVYNLTKGKNTIILKSEYGNNIKFKKIDLFVKEKNTAVKQKSQTKLKPLNALYVTTLEETALRQTPYGNRLTPVKKGVVFKAVGLINNHYKVPLDLQNFAYIAQNSAKPYHHNVSNIQKLDTIFFNEDSKNIIIKIPMEYPVLTQLTPENNLLKIKLSNTKQEFKNYYIKSPYIKEFNFSGDTLSLEINAENLVGYDYFYENNTLVLKIRKPFDKGLRGKIIAIDAGHGGKEKGSVGPTEVPEKDINIKIANFLKDFLEKRGATVVMTRKGDEFVGLYDRVKIAQQNNADILISIHNNALPDGGNPYITHGTSTYYYQKQALPLAHIVQDSLLEATGFPNLGVKHGSLVLTRPSMPISILIEVGFMINPFEYEALLNEQNQKKYAEAIGHAITKYFKIN